MCLNDIGVPEELIGVILYCLSHHKSVGELATRLNVPHEGFENRVRMHSFEDLE